MFWASIECILNGVRRVATISRMKLTMEEVPQIIAAVMQEAANAIDRSSFDELLYQSDGKDLEVRIAIRLEEERRG